MNSQLSSKELGQRITKLRKKNGHSQEDLAKLIGISRPSLAQIELGNRGVEIFELQKLSHILRFSLDDFMSEHFNQSQEPISTIESIPRTTIEDRISVPIIHQNKFKNVLLYLLEKCAGKPNVGETVLYKLLYFSDFNYYELYEEHLTGAQYRKLPYGPVPQKIDSLLNQMIENGSIQRFKTEYCGYPQTRYIPLQKADLTQFLASEKEVIDRVVEQLGDWSASSISNFSHNDLPWQVTEEGKEINYELAFYREAPYSVRNYNDEIETA